SSGSAAKEVKMLGEGLPDLPVIHPSVVAVFSRDPESFERNPLRIEHSENIVVGNQQQLGRGPESVIRVGKHARINMPMRAHQRRLRHAIIQVLRDLFLAGVGIKVAVRRQKDLGTARHYRSSFVFAKKDEYSTA